MTTHNQPYMSGGEWNEGLGTGCLCTLEQLHWNTLQAMEQNQEINIYIF